MTIKNRIEQLRRTLDTERELRVLSGDLIVGQALKPQRYDQARAIAESEGLMLTALMLSWLHRLQGLIPTEAPPHPKGKK